MSRLATTFQPALACALALVAGVAAAADFPVSGSVAFGGSSAPLPDGSFFGSSDYDASSGAIAAGAFHVPDGSVNVATDAGILVVQWRLSQTDTSAGLVATDGTAALADATMRLELLSAALLVPPVPIAIAPCTFEPITWQLSGTASATGLVLVDESFAVPEAAPGQCGDFREQINAALAGNAGSVELSLAGDFTPPGDSDLIFADGFDAG